MSGTQPLLQAEHVRLTFGGIKAISDVSFEVEKGEFFAVIGPNGAGKTSLFNCSTGSTARVRDRSRSKAGRSGPQPAEIAPRASPAPSRTSPCSRHDRAGQRGDGPPRHLRRVCSRAASTRGGRARGAGPTRPAERQIVDLLRLQDIRQRSGHAALRPAEARGAGPGPGARSRAAPPRRAHCGHERRGDQRPWCASSSTWRGSSG